jgi:lysozyme
MNTVTDATIALIKEFEGLVLHPYADAVGVPTIGYGTTVYPDGTHVSLNDPSITEDLAVIFLQHDVAKFAQDVGSLVTAALNDNQFGALVSFTYNLGEGALRSSTLLRKLNAGDYAGAAGQFPLWDHAGGRVLPGLLKRRQAEQALFLQPC